MDNMPKSALMFHAPAVSVQHKPQLFSHNVSVAVSLQGLARPALRLLVLLGVWRRHGVCRARGAGQRRGRLPAPAHGAPARSAGVLAFRPPEAQAARES